MNVFKVDCAAGFYDFDSAVSIENIVTVGAQYLLESMW